MWRVRGLLLVLWGFESLGRLGLLLGGVGDCGGAVCLKVLAWRAWEGEAQD